MFEKSFYLFVTVFNSWILITIKLLNDCWSSDEKQVHDWNTGCWQQKQDTIKVRDPGKQERKWAKWASQQHEQHSNRAKMDDVWVRSRLWGLDEAAAQSRGRSRSGQIRHTRKRGQRLNKWVRETNNVFLSVCFARNCVFTWELTFVLLTF